MLTYNMDERGKIPRYDYLYRCIKADILQGKIKSGERLPAKRALSEHLAVSVVTVENAYDQLLSEGYIYAKERSGYFVSPVKNLPPMPEANKTKISNEQPMPAIKWKYNFSSNTINEKYFPFSVWSRLLRETLTCGGEELLRRSPFNGEKELREALSRYLLHSRGISAPPENIVVGAGTESLYTLLVQLLGRERVYAVENPSYQKIAKVYLANEVKTAFVGLDKQGIRLDELKKSGASVLHISPSHHYPTGVVTGFSRRSEILAWAKEVSGYIIEDDYDSEFRLVGKPIQPMQALDREGRVIYINTFSKTLAPSIRIGYMVLPDGLMAKFRQKLGFYACAVPTFEQLTLSKFIDRGYFDRHLSRMRNVYRKRRDEAMELFLRSGYPLEISEENSGLHFLVKLKTDRSDEEVKSLAAAQGVKLTFLSDFALSDGEEMQHCIVVNYSEL
jgi:GntR family transcriptional regulator/MocR family aminotransferase